jgi:tetratricopeptide (TPR) repeat protein
MVTNVSQEGEAGSRGVGALRSRRWFLWAFLGAVAVAGGAAAFWWWPGNQPSVRAVANLDDDVDFDDAPIPNPGYLGPQACAACHAKRLAEFQKTRHFLACVPAQAEWMPPGFDPGRGAFATRLPDLHFEMTREGENFFQTAIHQTASGEKRSTAAIALVYGAGGTGDEVYHTWDGDRLSYLPMSWLRPLKRWGVSNSPYGAGNFSEETTTRCLECHTTYFQHVRGTLNEYKRDSLILGVTCERCHGPAQDHVNYQQAHPDAETARAIVHPGRLNREQQIDLCAQCHCNAVNRRDPPFSFRPGDALECHFRVIVTEHPEDDHVTNQVQYLRQSKCFQRSDALSCLTCHNPHRPTDSAAVGRACIKCHKPADCREQDRLPAGVRNDCVGCHMPKRVWINVYFHTDDDQYVPPIRRHAHRIAVYPEARDEVLLAWHRRQGDVVSQQEVGRITKALVDHWLTEAERCRRAHRFLAAIRCIREALRVQDTPAAREHLRRTVTIQAKLDADLATALRQIDEQRYAEAIETLNGILRVKPDSGKAHGRLGRVYALTGKTDPAVEHLQAAAKCDPDEAYGYSMLGGLAFRQDRMEDAAEFYRLAMEIEPYTAQITYHRGMALAKLEQLPKAIECFRRVLTIDPKHAGSCQALSHALRRQGEPAEAVRYAQRAARLTHFANADVLVSLADAYAEAGRFAEASDAASRALEAAVTSAPQLVPSIHRRLEQYSARTE